MEEKKQNEELQSRREFFKESAKKVLPMFAVAMLGSSALSSCYKEDFISCRSGCTGECDRSCTERCSGDCWDVCAYSCVDGTY